MSVSLTTALSDTEGDNLHCSPLDRPYKARILAYYPESAHGAHFDADAVCMVSYVLDIFHYCSVMLV